MTTLTKEQFQAKCEELDKKRHHRDVKDIKHFDTDFTTEGLYSDKTKYGSRVGVHFLRDDKKKFIIRRFDFINTWEGSVLYFLILLLILTFLKGYFFSNVTIIEINNIQEKIHKK